MDRRNALKSIVLAGIAPTFVPVERLMPIKPERWGVVNSLLGPGDSEPFVCVHHCRIYTPEEIEKESDSWKRYPRTISDQEHGVFTMHGFIPESQFPKAKETHFFP